MNLIREYHHFMSFNYKWMCNTNIHTTNAYSPTKSISKRNQGKTPIYKSSIQTATMCVCTQIKRHMLKRTFADWLRLILNAHRYWNGSFLPLQHPHLWQQKMKPSNWQWRAKIQAETRDAGKYTKCLRAPTSSEREREKRQRQRDRETGREKNTLNKINFLQTLQLKS